MEASVSLVEPTPADSLAPEQWRQRLHAHRARMQRWADFRRERAGRQEKHPVYDFMFEYYPFRAAELLRWSPGVGVLLERAEHNSFEGAQLLRQHQHGLILKSQDFPQQRRPFLNWALRYLQATQEREPRFCCFGLHEWAMVYKAQEVRHSAVPLRLSTAQISDLVETSELCCSHFDAFRFFTAEARPLNKLQLSRERTIDYDQPGCLHVNMDLYRFAFKVAAFIPSELLADCFEFALKVRELDMRASPYDLSRYGLDPVKIENLNGRELYVRYQRELASKANPLRLRLILAYARILAD